jgi:hypothetical protein
VGQAKRRPDKSLIGVGMVLFACLMAVGLVWRTPTRTGYDERPPAGT